MKFFQFEHELLPRILLPLLGGLFALAALQSAARAEPTPAAGGGYLVSASDGYGVNDCIKSGEDCAKIVADAWCAAHGHGDARAYGRADDMTATFNKTSGKAPAAPARRISDDDVFISCGE
jgi:hypothetical protein